jgi:hypothetical protein
VGIKNARALAVFGASTRGKTHPIAAHSLRSKSNRDATGRFGPRGELSNHGIVGRFDFHHNKIRLIILSL